MRSFIIKLALILVPIGLLVVVTNLLVDPANIFSGKSYVEGIADIMAKNHNVDNISNYDERLLQEAVIERRMKAADVVVLGSSRTMEINGHFFPGKTVLNCGVSHANIDDIIAIIGVLDSMKKLPGEVVIGLDPWLLCQGGTSDWQSLFTYHEFMMRKLSPGATYQREHESSGHFRKLSTLFSLNYFSSSLRFLLENKSKKYVDVGQARPAIYGRFADGTVCYSYEYMHPDLAAVAIHGETRGRRDGLPPADEVKIRQLDKLIRYLQEKKINIHLLKVPIYSAYYRAIEQHHRSELDEWKAIFKTIGNRHHISIAGNLDPVIVGMPDSVFYDEFHCSGEAIRRYIGGW